METLDHLATGYTGDAAIALIAVALGFFLRMFVEHKQKRDARGRFTRG